jgi:dTDP-4-amino-4,6-dideoxygalactose transaminase
MPDWRVPLADVEIGETEIEAVVETYRSGWLSMGPRTEALEERFAQYMGVEHAVGVSSGTAALHLSCLAAGIGPGDEVIVPSLTFVATASAVRMTGARPVFAEISSLQRPWLDAGAASEAIGPETKAILNMTYGGHPGDGMALAELAADRGLLFLEDAAHALGGTTVDGRRTGTLGKAAAFSFFSNKNLPVGEGGMLITDDDEVAKTARLLRSHGMTSLTWDRQRGHAAGYDVLRVGFNYRIDEPRAALAAARLDRLDADNARRRAAVNRYRERIGELEGATATEAAPPGAESADHLFTVVLDEDFDRDATRERLAADGIQTSVHYPPVHSFTAFEEEEVGLPLTEAYAARAVTLPLFPDITEEQIELVADSLARSMRGS